ncbi:hypothetical protein J7F02_06915 [Streptomyces sp. ISL-112]|uniref:hypothetical protein n=1 Tax=Streptomyces sp. ISL-112 TaxID=2819176 RepID=UPI001BE8F75F|nr:hypothetical protein [Streptomyces sp. ISL-112]MBT2425418.1 hypothetical protein [Streptomyces sp. ISL-112]
MAGPAPEGGAEAVAYRAAERDTALLREELGLLGDLLAREEPGAALSSVATPRPPARVADSRAVPWRRPPGPAP